MIIQTHKLFQCVTILFVGHLSHQCPAGLRGKRWICNHLGFEETHHTSVDPISLIRIVTWLHLGVTGYAASGQLQPKLYTMGYVCVCVCACVCVHVHAQSCPILCDPMDCSPPGSSAMEFSRQDFWSALPFPSPGNLPDPGIEPVALESPALAGRFFITSTTWKAPTLWKARMSFGELFIVSVRFPDQALLQHYFPLTGLLS